MTTHQIQELRTHLGPDATAVLADQLLDMAETLHDLTWIDSHRPENTEYMDADALDHLVAHASQTR